VYGNKHHFILVIATKAGVPNDVPALLSGDIISLTAPEVLAILKVNGEDAFAGVAVLMRTDIVFIKVVVFGAFTPKVYASLFTPAG
jgi:hypothetical protein